MVVVSALIGIIRGIAGASVTHRRAQRERALRMEDVDTMNGLAFEHYVAGLLKQQGYVATVTPSSGDLGVDVIAERGGIRHAVQVKRYTGSVSRRAIRSRSGFRNIKRTRGSRLPCEPAPCLSERSLCAEGLV